ncbi:MAG: DNA/RNA nuclease SfsA, partial [Candidatus Heimdallarchaeaceae archaeon]
MIIEGEYTYARFLDRPNRFLAKIELYSNEKVEYSHVPDPGRLKELLLPGVEVFVRKETRMNRKTKYSLIGVKAENGTWVNIDSQVSNKLFQSEMSKIKDFQNYKILKSEFSLGNSRIDFLLENLKDNKQALVEVKSVTLVEENIAFFPDAPTKRGVKHLRELEKAVQEKKYA